MSTVFISFASMDRAVAITICEALEHRGIGCWIATRDIAPGENFQHAIFHAIDTAKVMVLVFSANSHNSDEVKKELVLAGQRRLGVIPVRVEEVKPEGAFAYELATRQWVDLFNDWERSIQRLVEQITRVIGQRPGSAPLSVAPPASAAEVVDALASASPPEPTTAPARKGRLPLLGGVPVLAAAGIAAAAWFWTGGFAAKPPPPVAASVPAPKPAAAPVPAQPPGTDELNQGKAAYDRHDYAAAMRLYRQAADLGNAKAQTSVGYLYEKGRGVDRDYDEALRWYRLAAAQGQPAAQRNIGNFYEQGLGLPQDDAEAMRWFRLAADHGNAGAETNIGYLYEQGRGVPQDYAEAMRWYRLAADQGEATAQNNIGVLYDKGLGVAQDYREALSWYRMAAEQGDIEGEFNLALLYANGRGVQLDLNQARRWMEKAAEAGDPAAKTWLVNHGG